MSLIEHEVDIPTGRRDGDGRVRLSIFADELLALTLEGHGERAPTLLLTSTQARRLEEALAELIPLVEEPVSREQPGGPWQGKDRRARIS